VLVALALAAGLVSVWISARTGRALVVGPVACNGTNNPTVTSLQACADLATARCAETKACAPGTYAAQSSDTTCVHYDALLCERRLEAPSTVDDQYGIEGCTGVFAPDGGYSCPDYLASRTPQPCLPGSGALREGAGCAFDAQCESTFCALPAGGVCGACAAPRAAGDSCAGLDSCGAGGRLSCAASGKCVAPGAAGAACDPETAPCAATLDCVKGSCEPQGTLGGAPCDPMAGPGCVHALGLFCASSGTCAGITFAAAGAACNAAGGVECAASGLCVNGACVAPVDPLADAGVACDATKGPPCPHPWRCAGGACVLPDGNRCARPDAAPPVDANP
jgi:hypothetical protein